LPARYSVDPSAEIVIPLIAKVRFGHDPRSDETRPSTSTWGEGLGGGAGLGDGAGLGGDYIKELPKHANIGQTDTYLNAGRLALQDSIKRFDAARGKSVANVAPDRAPA
jgi:hypothetical protein